MVYCFFFHLVCMWSKRLLFSLLLRSGWVCVSAYFGLRWKYSEFATYPLFHSLLVFPPLRTHSLLCVCVCFWTVEMPESFLELLSKVSPSPLHSLRQMAVHFKYHYARCMHIIVRIYIKRMYSSGGNACMWVRVPPAYRSKGYNWTWNISFIRHCLIWNKIEAIE